MMDAAPLISVVIPAFNREETIIACLDSIVRQTYPAWEVIVVDDGSTDGTVRTVDSYHDKRVRCIRSDRNAGAQAARNTGIRAAKGEWIAFQDSDDTWAPEKLERQVAALAAVGFDPMTVVHTNGRVDREDGSTAPFYAPDVVKIDGADVRRSTLEESKVLFPTILASKTALTGIGLLDENVVAHQEWDTSIRLGAVCRFLFIDEPLFIWQRSSRPSISKSGKNDVEGYFYILQKHGEAMRREEGGAGIYREHLYRLLKRTLDFRLWDRYDSYRRTLRPGIDARMTVLHCLRLLKIRPADIVRKSEYRG